MTSPNVPNGAALVGRFIVEVPGERLTGLAAHEVSLLLEAPEGREAVIYRVHRVMDDGKMELIGVAPAAFQRLECIAYARREVRNARLDFDALEAHAAKSPPSCRIELRLVRNPDAELSAITALVFPAVCADAIGHWLTGVDRSLGDKLNAGSAAFDAIELLQVVRHVVLEPCR